MSNEKILIGTLGKGNYSQTIYKFGDYEPKSTEYVAEIIREHIKPDIIYIIGTKDSKWEIPDQKFKDYKKVVIPFGISTEDYWETFDILMNDIDVEGKEVYFDITHGFRSLPFFIFVVLSFFEKVKKATLKGVYYGNFEYPDNIKPIVDLLPILELNKWVEGYFLFNEYGDTSYVSKLLKDFHEKSTSKKEVSYIEKISKILDNLNISYGFNSIIHYDKYLNAIQEKIQENKDKFNVKSLKPVRFLFDNLNSYAKDFTSLKTEYEKELFLAKDYFNKNRFAQSVSMLREALLTFILEKLELDYQNIKYRESASGYLSKKDARHYVDDEFFNTINKIRNIRNKIDHCFMGRRDHAPDSLKEEDRKEIKHLIDKTEELMNKDVIKDKEGLKNKIFESVSYHESNT